MSCRWSFRLLAQLTLTVTLALSAAGAPAEPKESSVPDEPDALPLPLKQAQVQLFLENDMLAGSDRYYTNGFKLGGGVEVPLLESLLAPIPKSILDALTQPAPDGTEPISHFGLFIGQNMYTPRDITIAAPQPYDRPWAAWLYVGGVVQRVRGDRLDTAELDIGMVGPAALGRQVQTGWHRLIGVKQPQGWSNQIPNELAFMAAYLQKRRFGNDTVQIVPHAGLTLGTVMTLARAGGIVRVGSRMTGFGPDSIEPGGAMLQATREEDVRGERARGIRGCCEWYFFVGADYRLVARNIFLDGPMFRGGPSVDRRSAVHDLTSGFMFRYRQLNVSLTHIRRSEEFTTPMGGGGPQAFYSLNIGWQFE